MISRINIEEKMKEIEEPWSPVEVTKLNNQVVRLAMFKGEYPWHKHTKEDELFFVVKGKIIIRLREKKEKPDISLREGEMVVIPKGIEHSPKSSEESYVLMFEPIALKSKGD